MTRFIIMRILQGLLVLLAIYALTFVLVTLTPGSPFSSERAIRPEILEQIEAFYGFDKPPLERFWTSLTNALQGEFGPSAVYANRSVTDIIGEAFPVSLTLGAISLLVALGLGIPAGILAAVKKNTLLDYIPMSAAMIGICLPTFVLGPLLVLIFGINMQVLPVSGWGYPEFIVLPAATLGLFYAAYFARLTRGGMLEMLNQDFVRTARAKGVPGEHDHLEALPERRIDPRDHLSRPGACGHHLRLVRGRDDFPDPWPWPMVCQRRIEP